MPRQIFLFITFFLAGIFPGNASPSDSGEVFLLICLPGNSIVNVYGHSAIRIVRKAESFDMVYSWGVYDFSTSNFAWKFARGRLKYELDEVPYESFINEYLIEKRTVFSQKINLSQNEISKLVELININLRPENRKYLYDFLYDNCATRIRDLLEKVLDGKLKYAEVASSASVTFRQLLDSTEQSLPWLRFGTDFLIGKPGDRTADFRERMFLPLGLHLNLSLAQVSENAKKYPLLGKPSVILKFNGPNLKKIQWSSPVYFFSLMLVLLIFLSWRLRNRQIIRLMDIFLFLYLSIISILLIFFGFFSDHQVMKMNLLLVLFSPVMIIAFISLLARWNGKLWFIMIFLQALLFFPLILVFHQGVNPAVIPIVGIILLRAYRNLVY